MLDEETCCSICNTIIQGKGYQMASTYDAWPITNGKCCMSCYSTIVIPELEYLETSNS